MDKAISRTICIGNITSHAIINELKLKPIRS